MAGKIIQPDSAPGWSKDIPPNPDGSTFDVEMPGPGRLVFRYRESPLHLPRYMTVPVGILKGVLGQILMAEGQAQQIPPGGNGQPTAPPPQAS